MAGTEEHDVLSGHTTTGHEWDGIKELNAPLPRWWLYTYYATIIWSIGYFIAYPAWPLVSSYTRGVLDYSSRGEVVQELADLGRMRGQNFARLEKTSLADIRKDPDLNRIATAAGKAAFGDNCAPCHGLGAVGAKGYPNLNDDEWIWGGSLDDIHKTIVNGARATAFLDTRVGEMLAFGRQGMLKPAEIDTLTDYVRDIAGLEAMPAAAKAEGAKLFEANCATCHGSDGKGKLDVGAPNLTDAIWLYGSDRQTVHDTIFNGRNGVMPGWAGRLDPVTIKALTIYVHGLGGGK